MPARYLEYLFHGGETGSVPRLYITQTRCFCSFQDRVESCQRFFEWMDTCTLSLVSLPMHVEECLVTVGDASALQHQLQIRGLRFHE